MQRPLAGRAQIQTDQPHERINLMSEDAEDERLTVASRRDRAGPVIGAGGRARTRPTHGGAITYAGTMDLQQAQFP
jgi:hypothetical protein